MRKSSFHSGWPETPFATGCVVQVLFENKKVIKLATKIMLGINSNWLNWSVSKIIRLEID